MSGDESQVGTGGIATFIDSYEERQVVIAQGLDFHESDNTARNQNYERWASELESIPDAEEFERINRELREEFGSTVPSRDEAVLQGVAASLRRNIGPGFHDHLQQHVSGYTVNSDTEGEYTSDAQKVHFTVRLVSSKSDFKTALETEGIHVIYGGHSRYGRGACFDLYSGAANQHGEQWDHGTSNDNGLYRLAYPVILLEISDIEHHRYHFNPVAVEDTLPEISMRHPDARRGLRPIELSEEMRAYIDPYFESPSNRYYGRRLAGQLNVLIYADWSASLSAPHDLGATDIKCKCFCHFGCSSRLHFWEIVRRPNFKGWQRDTPPTDRFAYFTTAPSSGYTDAIWLRHWFNYATENNYQSWWGSLQYALRQTNRQLGAERAGYGIY